MTTTTSTSKIRAVLIDLSGTLHTGDQPIAGAREALEKLRQSGRRIKFLTNTSAKSTAQLLAQLNSSSLNLSVQRHELVTSVLATAAYVQKHQLTPLCLMEDTSDMPGAEQEHEEQEEEEESSSNTCTIPKQQVPSPTSRYDSVVVGLAPSHFHYQRLNEAFRILLQHPDNLIAIHRGNYYRPCKEEPLSLGPGAFVTALETASSCRRAKVMGKPSPTFFESALWEDIPREEMCMIGDDMLADIQGAQHVGIGTAILVKTGKYRAGDEDKLGSTTTPSGTSASSQFNFLVRPSIVEAIEYILST